MLRDLGTFRAWAPGDGLQCWLINRAAQGVPCGPPVVTQQRPGRPRVQVFCRFHLASRFIYGGVGRIASEMDREAREAVLAAHWDEYLTERAQRLDALHAELIAAIPEEFRPLVEAGMAAHVEPEGAPS